MDRGILVLNTGSSSLKFALYREPAGGGLALPCQGEVERMMTKPRFAVHDAAGKLLGGNEWPAPIDAETAFRFVLQWVDTNQSGTKVVGVGHRVAQGGTRYPEPTLVDADALILPRWPVAPGTAAPAAGGGGHPHHRAHPSRHEAGRGVRHLPPPHHARNGAALRRAEVGAR